MHVKCTNVAKWQSGCQTTTTINKGKVKVKVNVDLYSASS